VTDWARQVEQAIRYRPWASDALISEGTGLDIELIKRVRVEMGQRRQPIDEVYRELLTLRHAGERRAQLQRMAREVEEG
jgi:hypothetical protein